MFLRQLRNTFRLEIMTCFFGFKNKTIMKYGGKNSKHREIQWRY